MYKDNIDIEKGIAYLAGKKEIYIKIVNTFTKSVDVKSEELRKFFADGDFNRLTMEFHGLKSSSATVGSTALPPLAQELESAGKAGNNELIIEKFEMFIEQYKDTCGALNEVAANLS